MYENSHVFGPISVNFLEHFGIPFATENVPEAAAERFYYEKRDSEQTLLFTMN